METLVEPWFEVEAKWKSTLFAHLTLLQSHNQSTEEYIAKYKCLSEPKGILLIAEDGDILLKNLGCSGTVNFGLSANKMVPVLLNKAISDELQQFVKKLQDEETMSHG